MTTIDQSGVVTLRCGAEACSRWQTAQARHLENILAGGPWLCPDHASKETAQ